MFLKKTTGQRLKRANARTSILPEYGTIKEIFHDSPSAGEWILFQLTAELSASNGTTLSTPVAATILQSFDGANIGASVTVSNATAAKGLIGAIGQAVKVSGDWVAIEIDTPSQFIFATAGTHSHSWAGSAGSPSTSMPSAVTTLTISSPTLLSEWPTHNQAGIDQSLPIKNPYGFFWRSGDKLILMHSKASGGQYEVVEVVNSPITVKFRLTANCPIGSVNPTCTANIILPMDRNGVLPSGSISIYDKYCLAHNAKGNATDGYDMGLATFNIADGIWECIECEHVATDLLGEIVYGGFSGTPSSFTVNNLVGLNGRGPISQINCVNKFGWASGASGGDVLVMWNNVAGEYFAVQMDCP